MGKDDYDERIEGTANLERPREPSRLRWERGDLRVIKKAEWEAMKAARKAAGYQKKDG